jgi:hypothetical protein
MWTMIGSLEPIVALLQPAFTQPSFASSCRLLLACEVDPICWTEECAFHSGIKIVV